jgi:myo-inositol-1(or 4)-monophosphatase
MRVTAAPADGDQARLLADFELLQSAVREAGALALGYFGGEVASRKKADGTRVSEADLAVDALLHTRLMHDRPSYAWLSEETADDPRRLDCRSVWIVDPIDGTHAFLDGKPEWTIAAALVEDGAPVLAAVFNPATAEMFTAQAGQGAHLNGEKITVTDRSAIEGATVIASSGLFKKKIWSEPWPPMQVKWIHSVAYRLALIAAGRADATISPTPKSEWDLAAPTLLVHEAGGIVTEIDGSPLLFNRPTPRHNGLVAAGRDLHRLLVERTRTVAGPTHNR